MLDFAFGVSIYGSSGYCIYMQRALTLHGIVHITLMWLHYHMLACTARLYLIRFRIQPGWEVGFITCSSFYFQKNINSLHEHIKTGNLSRAREHLTDETASIKDRAGRSSLHIAVLYQRKFVVKHLLKSYPGTVHSKDDVSLLLISYLLSSIELDIQRIHRGVLIHCVNPRFGLWKVKKEII